MADIKTPFDSGYLKVDDIHNIHYEQYGRPDGKAVVFLHGGPGGQTSQANTKYFDLSIFRVVLFDQRGAGKSTPSAELRENNTQRLVEDIETLRCHIGVDQWHIVFGGSWGATLTLAYAQTHPKVVKSLIIRGVWTSRKDEIQFVSGVGGAAHLYPAEHERVVGYLPREDRLNKAAGYYKLMQSSDREVRKAAAREWNRWGMTISSLSTPPNAYDKLDDENWSINHATLETHYAVHSAFLEEGQLLKEANVDRIRHLRVSIVQGRYDLVTPPQTAWDLHKLLPKSELHIVQGAGHAASDPGMTEKLQEAVRAHIEL